VAPKPPRAARGIVTSALIEKPQRHRLTVLLRNCRSRPPNYLLKPSGRFEQASPAKWRA
jgi:hypothetical protein